MDALIQVEQVSLKIKNKVLLNNISFEVYQGERVTFLGLNGAGKTTLLNAILNFTHIDEGNIFIQGKAHTEANFQNISFLTNYSNLVPKLSVIENIKYFCLLLNQKFAEIDKHYFELFEINKIKNTLAEKLSSGETRRVNLLLTMMKKADILFLDEPFTNIDPIRTNQIGKTIQDKPRTLIYTTQDWDDIVTQATHIVALHDGKMMLHKTSTTEFMSLISETKKIIVDKNNQLLELVKGFNFYIDNNKMVIFCDKPDELLQNILPITTNFSIADKTIKDIYAYLVFTQHK